MTFASVSIIAAFFGVLICRAMVIDVNSLPEVKRLVRIRFYVLLVALSLLLILLLTTTGAGLWLWNLFPAYDPPT